MSRLYSQSGLSRKDGRAKESLLENDPPNWDDDDDYAFLYAPQPKRSLMRAAALTMLSLLTVVATVSVLTYKKGPVFSGKMRLVSVSVVHRHGARSSLSRQTWEPNEWVEGYGELTVEGMQQVYHLGQQLRNRYVDLLHLLPSNTFAARDSVKVRSSALDRTQESAFALLMGLFDGNKEALPNMPEFCSCRPREGGQTDRLSTPECVSRCMGLNNSFVAREIPLVEVEPLEDDWLLRQHEVCAGWSPGTEDTEMWKETAETYAKAFDDAVSFLGVDRLCQFKQANNTAEGRVCSGPPLGMRDLQKLYDNLLCAETAGKPCPPEAGLGCRSLLASLHPVSEFLWNYDFESPRAVYAGGMLLGDILENMKRARKWHVPLEDQPQNDAGPPPSMYLYSASDTNLAALIGAMRAPWFHAPRFASYIAVELWAPRSGDMSNEELWMVNVQYDGQTLKSLPGCEHGSCRFKDFFYKQFWTQAMYEEDCRPRRA